MHDPSDRARRLRRALIGTTALVAVALVGTLLIVPATPVFAGGGTGGASSDGNPGAPGGADSAAGTGGYGAYDGTGGSPGAAGLGGAAGGAPSPWKPAAARCRPMPTLRRAASSLAPAGLPRPGTAR